VPDLTRPIAIVIPRYGLANRLRGIASTLAIARRFRIPFGMVWQSGPGFDDVAWHDLFANDYPLLEPSVIDAADAAGLPRASRWIRTPELDKPRHIRRAIRRIGFVNDEGWHDLDWLLRKRGATIRGCKRLNAVACRELRPAPAIAKEVDAFVTEHFTGRPMIGVHIRRGADAMKGPYRDDFISSTDDAFERAIERTSAARPDARYFLATDCATTHDRFIARFGERMVSRPKPYVETEYLGPIREVTHAACDFFLLSRTTRIIGNAGSTFSKQAARVGGIEMVRAEEV
jgi:hypothetical protein